MRRLFIAAAILAAIASAPAHAWIAQRGAVGATSSQVFLGGGAANNTTTRFFALNFVMNSTSAVYVPMTVFSKPGTVSNLLAFFPIALTGSQTYTATLWKNGASESASGMTCVLNSSNGATGCAGTGSVSFAAGDTAAIQVTVTGGPSTGLLTTSTIFTPTTAGDTLMGSWGTGFSNSVSQTQSISGGTITTATTSTNFPDGGTIDNFYVVSNDPTAATSSYTYTPRLGTTSQTSQACTIAAGSTTCNQSPLTTSFSVTGATTGAAGSSVAFNAAPTNTPTAAIVGFGVRYIPTTTNAFAIIGSQNGGAQDSLTLDTFYQISTGPPTGSPTENTQQQISNSMTIIKFAAKTTVAPGAAASGKKRTMTMRVNGVDTAATCDVVELRTDCLWTGGTVAVASGDRITVKDTPTASASQGFPSFSAEATR